MSEPPSKDDRPGLPRDAFRGQRTAAESVPPPIVVTPNYEDKTTPRAAPPSHPTGQETASLVPFAPKALRPPPSKPRAQSDSLDAYGERSSSRPYALRLPGPIDVVLRQIAAEERTHPLRIIDRVLYDYLRRIGRLPPLGDP